MPRWPAVLAFLAAVLLGAATGLGAFTFVYARGSSYLGNDPATCADCHVMQEHYDAWQNSSHHHVAICNDCHAPPGGLAKCRERRRGPGLPAPGAVLRRLGPPPPPAAPTAEPPP